MKKFKVSFVYVVEYDTTCIVKADSIEDAKQKVIACEYIEEQINDSRTCGHKNFQVEHLRPKLRSVEV